ncbi:hypothetical protein OFQ59_03675 [Brachyspira hyodysenteriae]|uniref:hypothetical protein n=1 Tax=Brachyspira hyodysenteriae TaxID=159 RepID=UPI0022CE2F1B|nr:hypothetical protein [Brachyspira hyodysenteriae]MCZ9847504.1 hypothetical protein [Brachyspira hyodysenteriae]MCZ9969176.1 hypothetical protein [Brachyspira hyodysenteriae]MDA0073864.1 hypothetical protein [Brachyspira hyodysenteriae]MDA0073865.1 hypothetical protein [Brachyspira hyodysenteriae]
MPSIERAFLSLIFVFNLVISVFNASCLDFHFSTSFLASSNLSARTAPAASNTFKSRYIPLSKYSCAFLYSSVTFL